MLRTSHVGSFPLPYSPENIETVVRDLAGIGIDAPPYPQLRSFIDVYLKPLADHGILKLRGSFYYLEDPEKIREIEYIEPNIPEAEYMADKNKRENLFQWLRGPVTGPFTLSSRIYVEKDISKGLAATLLRNKELLGVMAGYVRRNLEYLAGLGYNILFIDEPVLGVIVGRRRILLGYNRQDITNTIVEVFRGLPGEHGIHVCGRVSPTLYNMLVEAEEPRILNFEFHDNPKNIDFLDPETLEAYDKIIAPGIASSKKPRIEEVDELKNLLTRIGEKTGWRIDLVSADCGFGGLATEDNDPIHAYKIGIEKLKRIKKVVEDLED